MPAVSQSDQEAGALASEITWHSTLVIGSKEPSAHYSEIWGGLML